MGVAPYYEDSSVTIYHGDCRDVLPDIRCNGAAIADPPYNVGLKYGADTDDTRADYAEWCTEWFGLLRQSVTGPVAISCGMVNVGLWNTIEVPTWMLAWHKPAAMGRCVVGFNNWEPILLYGKTPSQIVDVIRAPIRPDSSMDGHPCPKPLEWAAQQIGALTKAGDTVVDPFLGSGTTVLAAKNMNRRAIGIEIEERYCEIAARRLSQEVLDLGGAA